MQGLPAECVALIKPVFDNLSPGALWVAALAACPAHMPLGSSATGTLCTHAPRFVLPAPPSNSAPAAPPCRAPGHPPRSLPSLVQGRGDGRVRRARLQPHPRLHPS